MELILTLDTLIHYLLVKLCDLLWLELFYSY